MTLQPNRRHPLSVVRRATRPVGRRLFSALAGALLLTGFAAGANARDCFFISQWEGWRSPSPKVIYLKVNLHDVYRVDLSAPSDLLVDWKNNKLFSHNRGSSSICTASDLDLYVTNLTGVSEPLFPLTLVKLTPSEAEAIPPQFRPG